MTTKNRFFDLWIVESNTVYREVPYSVVTDWLQQGRLLVSDKARPSGSGDWHELGQLPEMAVYLPRREEHRAEDMAESLEPVELDMAWKRRTEDDDQDVDMIPLIDVSLVLLIFFMMTSTVGTLASMDVPEVHHVPTFVSSDPLWIGIEPNKKDKDGPAVYSIGQGGGSALADDKNLDFEAMLRQLDAKLATLGSVEQLTIRGDKSIQSGAIKRLRGELEGRKRKGLIKKIGDEVIERPNS